MNQTIQFEESTLSHARGIMEQARTIFRVRAAYMMPVLTRAGLVWAPVGTAGVSKGNRLFFDPRCAVKFATAEGVETIAGVLAHECLHITLKHMLRRGNRDARRWNIAADLYINGLLVSAGWELPSCGVFPETGSKKYPATKFNGAGGELTIPAGLTAEEIYDLLPSDAQRSEPQESGPCDGECGSGSGGEEMEGEPQEGDTDAHGGKIEDVTESEIEAARDAVARKVAESAAKEAGTLAGALSVWAGKRIAPPVASWSAILRRKGSAVIQRAGGSRKTYRRPHRRAACMGSHPRNPIRASYERTTARVWYAVDTSGSMSQEDHAHAVGNLLAVAGAAGDVYVLACDSQVQGEPIKLPKSRTQALALVEKMLKGGGGTDFRPIFAQAEAATGKERPDLVVVATDGYGPAPESASVPTVWLCTPGGRAPAVWGETIKIEK